MRGVIYISPGAATFDADRARYGVEGRAMKKPHGKVKAHNTPTKTNHQGAAITRAKATTIVAATAHGNEWS
jgi:hypothetical protein